MLHATWKYYQHLMLVYQPAVVASCCNCGGATDHVNRSVIGEKRTKGHATDTMCVWQKSIIASFSNFHDLVSGNDVNCWLPTYSLPVHLRTHSRLAENSKIQVVFNSSLSEWVKVILLLSVQWQISSNGITKRVRWIHPGEHNGNLMQSSFCN